LNSSFFDYAGFCFEEALRPGQLAEQVEQLKFELRNYIELTRETIAQTLGISSPQILLTGGSTQAFKQLLLNASIFPEQGTVVCSDLIYPKMYNMLAARCQKLTVVPISTLENGMEMVRLLASKVNNCTKVMMVDVVDNRRGIAIPLDALAEQVRSRNPNCRIVLDASQAYRQLPQLKISSDYYDFLFADLKKWCGFKTFTGVGFLAVSSMAQLEHVARTADSQFAVHPSLLAYSVGYADAGGADFWSWCLAHQYVNEAFEDFETQNQTKAQEFIRCMKATREDIRLWPSEESIWNTGIVSIVGKTQYLQTLYETLKEKGIFCSLIPTNLAPFPKALRKDEACLRFSFHDLKTSSEDVRRLVDLLQSLMIPEQKEHYSHIGAG